jgi:hypothetical protein
MSHYKYVKSTPAPFSSVVKDFEDGIEFFVKIHTQNRTCYFEYEKLTNLSDLLRCYNDESLLVQEKIDPMRAAKDAILADMQIAKPELFTAFLSMSVTSEAKEFDRDFMRLSMIAVDAYRAAGGELDND